MELLQKYYLRFSILLISCNIIKGQVNCKAFENDDCRKACKLVNLAEVIQGQKYSQIAFDEAIKLCPGFDYAYREKSVPYLKRGDFVTWKILIDKAVELNPTANLGYRGWCQFQFLRNYNSAIEDIEKFEKLVGEDNVGSSQNGDHNLEIVKALCYKGKGDKIKAIQIIENQLSKEKYSPMLFDYYHLGVLYYELNNNIKAKEYFEKQISNNDYYAEPYYYLSLIYLNLNNKTEAEKMIDKALYYYSHNKYLKDAYNVFIDKIYEKEMKIIKVKLQE
jgi:tetratricopeptide (TPR) repeat protein